MLTAASLGSFLVSSLTVEPSYLVRRNAAATLVDHFLDWLSHQEKGRPFFAFLNLFDAHYVYRPPPGYEERFGPLGDHLMQLFRRGLRWSAWSAPEQQGFVDAYDACVAYVDDQVGRLVEELRARALLDNTLVVITADHGEHFGEHDLMEHANSLYLPLLQVPLIVHFRGRVPEGRRVAELVSLADLPATVLELIGATAAAGIPGHSWSPARTTGEGAASPTPVVAELRRRTEPPPWAKATSNDMRSIFLGELQYILGHQGREELYDVRADRGQERDLAPSRPADVARLRAALAEVIGRR